MTATEPLARSPAAAMPESVMAVLKRQEPAMAVKDEMIFLLHTAAEIEHSLLTQYLYAMYSISDSELQSEWRSTLMGIAREEMGHLMSIQNILLALGGALNLEREDHPFNSFYPFPFRLEPLSVQTLARYVLAEMPERNQIPDAMGFDLDAVSQDAGYPTAEAAVNRVGALFHLLGELASELDDDDLMAAARDLQADGISWRAPQFGLVMEQVSSIPDIVALIKNIGTQGEGSGLPSDASTSHFARFYRMYRQALDLRSTSRGKPISHLVPVNPTVLDVDAPGYLSNPEARTWGDVFNHRMRWLLTFIAHYLQVTDPNQRIQLRVWAFEEMTFLNQIAEKLISLPQHMPPSTSPEGRLHRAGPSFELPYSLNLPDQPLTIWRLQGLFVQHSLRQLEPLSQTDPTVFLLKDAARQRAEIMDRFLSPGSA